ncbi:MAG: outer membrane lipoprotein-sorting protein [Sulfurovum sp.]|nr:outer membrane lipoprotein-sorting protein [Sulfurovum sp.]
MLKVTAILVLSLVFCVQSGANLAEEIAQKSYDVNHAMAFKNIMIKKRNRSSIISVSRSVGVKPRITAVERFLSNDYDDGVVKSKDIIIIRSGKLNGLGILMTSYLDPKRSHQFMMWLPALRKVRRMAEPQDAGIGAGDIAFLQDVKLRRFDEEKYTLMQTKVMDIELLMMAFKKGELGRYGKGFPYKKSTKIRKRKIYVVKSTYKKKAHWYDYRISYIDSEYFTDYKTKYYKNGKHIKEVHRHWTSIGNNTKSTLKIWYYWYSKDTDTGYEMATYIPKKRIKTNQNIKNAFWHTRTLKKIKR